MFIFLLFRFIFILSGLQESIKIIDLVLESAPVIFLIQSIIESVKNNKKEIENNPELGKKMVAKVTDRGQKDNTGNRKDDVYRAITLKDLSNLTNSVTSLYSKNTDFVLFRDILNSLIQYQMVIMSWSEKAQLLLPIQSTRSKMGKDMKSTKISDLELVKQHSEILLSVNIAVFSKLYFDAFTFPFF